ncbi:hypothetical protein [Taibaiella soli]|uniref:Uncharacterized protein n=1 Tax=Taibaiella soli TaxID=1649169 RepID=A0A2W2AYC0_9BACT|nr:hypothetical protein [Taibaiella soli]PZF73044.1 hypothetical protein DN068_09225 [Taibaiella soli]
MRPKLLLLLLIPMSFTACKKDKDWKSAVVVNTGDITAAGCGFVLKMDDLSEQKPINLPTAYTYDGLAVKVKFHTVNSPVSCNTADGTKNMASIEIDDIKRDLN